MKIGRNDPCPCGSGKKYKQCCLVAQMSEAQSPAQSAWRRIRLELEGLPPRMLRFAIEVYGPDVLDEAWQEFFLWEEGEEEFFPDSPQLSVFMPWFLHTWVPDPMETDVADVALHGVSPAKLYLQRHARKLSPLLREYLESCLEHPFSFYEITHCESGAGFGLCDVLTGERFEVLEQSASEFLGPGDIIYAQLASAQGLVLLEAIGPVAIPPGDKVEIIELRRRMRLRDGGGLADRTELYLWGLEIRELYLELSGQRLDPSLPELQTTEGDPVEFHKLYFEIHSAQKAFDALKHLGIAGQEDATHSADDELLEVRWQWLAAESSPADDGRTVLGDLHIENQLLVAELASRQRAERFCAIVVDALDDAATFIRDEVRTTQQAFGDWQSIMDAAPPDEVLEADPEIRMALDAMLRRHYEEWVDTQIPALAERTPRQAVAEDADGREQVAAMVRQAERHARASRPDADVTIFRDMRRTLGLDAEP